MKTLYSVRALRANIPGLLLLIVLNYLVSDSSRCKICHWLTNDSFPFAICINSYDVYILIANAVIKSLLNCR